MSPQPKSRPPRLIFALTLAERRLRRWIDTRGRPHGLTAAGTGVLFHLATHPDATVGDITSALNASPAGTSGLLARMETAGLLTRTPAEHDRRTLHIALTDAGHHALAEAHVAVDELNDHLTSDFTPDELDTVHRWLTHVAEISDD